MCLLKYLWDVLPTFNRVAVFTSLGCMRYGYVPDKNSLSYNTFPHSSLYQQKYINHKRFTFWWSPTYQHRSLTVCFWLRVQETVTNKRQMTCSYVCSKRITLRHVPSWGSLVCMAWRRITSFLMKIVQASLVNTLPSSSMVLLPLWKSIDHRTWFIYLFYL